MGGRLHCYSFHSVKGGVGKSTLAVITALHHAQQQDAKKVALLDMDLTGTSLADVLPLEAPRWEGAEPAVRGDFLRPPAGFWSRQETERCIEQRVPGTLGIPFLNDFLLFATPDWDANEDLNPRSLLWKMKDHDPERLRIFPSSALPDDLWETIPVVFDENHSAFLEGRLEYLLDGLIPDEGEQVVVFDTPPTIPGLSRAVLSLAFRIGRDGEKEELSEDGGMPARLKEADVRWTAFLVTSMDVQDLLAAARWLALVPEADQRCVRVLVNRAPPGDEVELRGRLGDIVLRKLGQPNPLLANARFVFEDQGLQFFQEEESPQMEAGWASFLDKEETR